MFFFNKKYKFNNNLYRMFPNSDVTHAHMNLDVDIDGNFKLVCYI